MLSATRPRAAAAVLTAVTGNDRHFTPSRSTISGCPESVSSTPSAFAITASPCASASRLVSSARIRLISVSSSPFVILA